MNSELRRLLQAMCHARVDNYVLPGLTSWLVGGAGYGRLRILESHRDSREWVTPHSHRFDFVCLVLRGEVENIILERGGGVGSNCYAVGLLVPEDGGMGKYRVERTNQMGNWIEKRETFKAGAYYSMRHNAIHSIRFANDTEVLFFEGPDVADQSVFLEPVVDGHVVPTFETKPWMFQRAPPERDLVDALQDAS